MAQWESQTRKMNRHYQSSGNRQEGPLWSPPDYLDGEGWVGYFNESGGTCSLSIATSGTTYTLQGDYFDNEGNWLWEDVAVFDLGAAPIRTESVRRGTRTFVEQWTYTTVTVPTTIVTFPISSATPTETIFDGTSTPPQVTPWIDTTTKLVLEYTDLYEIIGGSGSIWAYSVWWKVQGNTSNYQYVNDSYSVEYEYL